MSEVSPRNISISEGKAREVPRAFKLPTDLSPSLKEAITYATFCPYTLVKSDAVLVLASADVADAFKPVLESMIQLRVGDRVIIAGGVTPFRGDHARDFNFNLTEAAIHLKSISPKLRRIQQIVLEENSTNFKENVEYGLRHLTEHPQYYNIQIIAQAYASRRAALTVGKYLPANYNFSLWGVEAKYPGTNVPLNASSWHTTQVGRDWVGGELPRIKKFGSRGDFLYPPDIESAINFIGSQGIEIPTEF